MENRVQLQRSIGNTLQLQVSPSLKVPKLEQKQENFSPQSSVGKLMVFYDSLSSKVKKVNQYNLQSESSQGKISCFQDSVASEDWGNSSGSIVLHQKVVF